MTPPPVEALVALHAERMERAWLTGECQRGAVDKDEPCEICDHLREHWPARRPKGER